MSNIYLGLPAAWEATRKANAKVVTFRKTQKLPIEKVFKNLGYMAYRDTTTDVALFYTLEFRSSERYHERNRGYLGLYHLPLVEILARSLLRGSFLFPDSLAGASSIVCYTFIDTLVFLFDCFCAF